MSSSVHFTSADTPDQTGRTAVVTGASSGLGELLAEHLAAAGAHVVMAVRNPGKGERVRDSMLQRHPGAQLEVAELDLADLDSERRYSRSAVYARSKTLHMVWALEHQRRLVQAGSRIRSLVAHPGMVTTPMNTGLTSRRDRLLAVVLGKLWGAREPEQGVRPLLYAATSPDASPGVFTGPYRSKDDALVGFDAFRAPVTDLGLAARVWDTTEQVLGLADPAVPVRLEPSEQ